MIKNAILLLIFATLFFAFDGLKMSKGAWKKVDKAISQIWNVDEIQKTQIKWSDIEMAELQLKGVELLYAVSDQSNHKLGYFVVSQAPSRYDNFDLVVLFDLEMKIVKSDILVYREDWGGEITSTRWLKQFIGKTAADRLQLNHGIQGISGATISCRSAINEIDRLTKLLTALNQSGQL